MNFNDRKLKIGVVGAGPAGSIAAYLMALKGHDVVILERKKEIDRKVCGEYLCPDGVGLLKELGIFEKVCRGFLDLEGMVLNSPSGINVFSYFPLGKKNIKNGISLNRKNFDQALLNLAINNGAKVFFDKLVTHVEFDSDNKCRLKTEDQESFDFDFLVAADGRQSKVGSLLKHMSPIDTKRAALHVFLPRKTARGVRLGEMHILSKNRYCGLDPITDDEVNVSVVCDSVLLKKESAKEILNNVIKDSKRLSEMFDLVSDKSEIQIVSSLKNKNHFIAGKNLAYVGDAAGFIDPLTGEGIYNALLSSHLLVTELSKAKNIEEGLSRYKIEKRKLSFQKNVLNHFFQFLIRRPRLVNLVGKFLSKSQERANHFIGIIGNIHTPVEGLIKMIKA